MKQNNCPKRTLRTIACAALFLICLVPAVRAAVFSSAGSGNYQTPSTWVNNAVPGDADTVVIKTGHNVYLGSAMTNAGVTVETGAIWGIGTNNSTSRVITIAGSLANFGIITNGPGSSSSPTYNLTFSSAGTWTGSADIGKGNFKFRVTVPAGASLDISGLSAPLRFRSTGTQPFNVNGTLITGMQTVDGNNNASATFTLAAGATLITANTNGIINGNLGTLKYLTAPTLSESATYVFRGTAHQFTMGLPATVSDLIIDNPAGVTLSQPTTVNSSCQLQQVTSLKLPVVGGGVPSLQISTFTTGIPEGSPAKHTIHVTSMPTGVAMNDTLPLINYGALNGSFTNFVLGTLPTGYTGHLAEVGSSISLVIDSVPKPVTWAGTVNGDWDTATANWSGNAKFANGDSATFDDTAPGTTTVNLTTALFPGGLVVSNDLKGYTFSGPGSIGGTSGLIKEGANSLTLANTGTDTFSGPIALNAGTLIFNRNINTVDNHVISGAGAILKSGSGTLSLNNANSYTGGTTINGGAVRLGSATSAGVGDIVVNAGATLVGSSGAANAITLNNATFGSSVGGTFSGALTIPPGTTSTLVNDDPLSPGVLANLLFTGTLSGSGNINIQGSSLTSNPDSTSAGCRFNGISDGGYSGTIRVGNSVKAELQFTTAAPFSSIGTGKLVLVCGTNAPSGMEGTYPNLLIRNNNTGDAVFGNNIELAGTGFVTLNPLGTSPSGSASVMGNLRVGNGQTVGIYRNGGNLITVSFPTATLTGGTVTFAPRPVTFAASANGSDISIGDLNQTAASSVVVNGLRTLTLTGSATHTGTTTISNGTLNVTGSLAGNGAVTVAGGNLTGVGSIAGLVTVLPGANLAPGSATMGTNYTPAFGLGTLTINNNLSLAGNVIIDVDKSLSPSNDVVNVTGAITYSGTVTVTNLGLDAFVLGDQFKIFPNGGTGSLTVLGSPAPGLSWKFTPSNGTLSVVNLTPPTLSFSRSGGALTISWTEAGFKLQAQTNSISTGLGANWSDYPGGNVSPVIVNADPASPTVFFRLINQ